MVMVMSSRGIAASAGHYGEKGIALFFHCFEGHTYTVQNRPSSDNFTNRIDGRPGTAAEGIQNQTHNSTQRYTMIERLLFLASIWIDRLELIFFFLSSPWSLLFGGHKIARMSLSNSSPNQSSISARMLCFVNFCSLYSIV